ncbi:MAG: SAM-dependent methyltransferase [Bacteroidales bacterium]|nr:SAM-dependent methyltransferase [Bacteroidales bacterium]
MDIELGQFFTREAMSSVLAQCLGPKKPKIAVDVSVGEGALLKAIQKRWRNTKLLGVEFDRKLKIKNICEAVQLFGNGLDVNLPGTIRQLYGEIDLAVNNPPFKSIRRSESTDQILGDCGLLGAIGKSKNYPAEIVFLAQNLRILSRNGTLAIIVPSGIINNDRWKGLRSSLLRSNRVLKAIELPPRIFDKTEARTFMLVLRKGGVTDKVSLYNAGPDGEIGESISISKSQAEHRMDWRYYNEIDSASPHDISLDSVFTLEDLGAEIFRGQISSVEARCKSVNVFHTTDMTGIGQIKDFKTKSRSSVYRTAKSGDILVARVGTRCIGRTCFLKKGELIVSDCIYVIRLEPRFRQLVWKKFATEEFSGELRKLARGVCAQYVTKKQLLDITIIN